MFIKNRINLILVILFSLFICYLNLSGIFLDDSVVQDDFRQSFYWIWKLWDSSLFENCFFIDMYRSHLVRMPILNLIYNLGPFLVKSPILYSKILAVLISVLTSISAYFMMNSFMNSRKEVKAKFIALMFSFVVSVMIWCTDHVSVAHSRSFIWMGLFIFLLLENEKKDFLKSLWIFVLLLLSPFAFLLCLGMQFFSWLFNLLKLFPRSELKNILDINFYALAFNTLAVLFLYKVIFSDVATQGVGTEFSRSEMELLPEFNPGGRHPIFGVSIFDYAFWSDAHWGFSIGTYEVSVMVPVAIVSLIVFLLLKKFLFRDKIFVFCDSVSPAKPSWLQHPLSLLFYSSMSLYFAAMITFPLIFLPSRYIANSSLVLAVTGLFLLIHSCFRRIASLESLSVFFDYSRREFVLKKLPYLLFAIIFLIVYSNFFQPRFVQMDKEILAIAKQSPKDSLFAAHPKLAAINALSATAKRRVFINHEWSMAYTKESLDEIRRRNIENLKMIYAPTREEFLEIAHREGITHVIAHRRFYTKQYLKNPKYLEPYNELLRKLVERGQSEGFYLQQYLKDRGKLKWVVIGLGDLK